MTWLGAVRRSQIDCLRGCMLAISAIVPQCYAPCNSHRPSKACPDAPSSGRELAQPSIDLCDDGRLEFIEEAGNFVQHKEPERVNDLIVDFLRNAM